MIITMMVRVLIIVIIIIIIILIKEILSNGLARYMPHVIGKLFLTTIVIIK